MAKIEFIVSGDTGSERSEELKRLYRLWRDTGSCPQPGILGKSVATRVIITNPARETSVEHSVRYACGELEDGIVEAGGTIWDGTHVQITREKADTR